MSITGNVIFGEAGNIIGTVNALRSVQDILHAVRDGSLVRRANELVEKLLLPGERYRIRFNKDGPSELRYYDGTSLVICGEILLEVMQNLFDRGILTTSEAMLYMPDMRKFSIEFREYFCGKINRLFPTEE
ncbi:MAG: hypothetical protein GY861_21010 [bacterium]|nr:hypothetical protein [bacterium]